MKKPYVMSIWIIVANLLFTGYNLVVATQPVQYVLVGINLTIGVIGILTHIINKTSTPD